MGAEQSLCCDKRNDSSKAGDARLKDVRQEVNGGSNPGDSTWTRDDAHSAATTPPNGSSPEKVGIGAYFQRSAIDTNGLAVKSLLKGSPAERCGKIAVGDIVLEVNGDNVYGKKLAELAQVLLGPPGSSVQMTFKSIGGGSEYTVKLDRGIPGYS